MDAIRAFAGVDLNKAVIEPDAMAALIEYDTIVTHYEIIEEVSVPEAK
jgi:hypothetical protein